MTPKQQWDCLRKKRGVHAEFYDHISASVGVCGSGAQCPVSLVNLQIMIRSPFLKDVQQPTKKPYKRTEKMLKYQSQT
ncbi:hypothetical protein FKM82_024880 [Ascaphus truei]